jgi:uncharacterized protein with HEPN domain
VSPKRAWAQRARDILEAMAEIRSFITGQTYEQFASDARTLKAVLADFGIIGEAARHIPEELQRKYPEIEWRKMRDMRNVIVHVYFGIKPEIVWATIQNDFAVLERQLQQLIVSEETPGGRAPE